MRVISEVRGGINEIKVKSVLVEKLFDHSRVKGIGHFDGAIDLTGSDQKL